MTVFMPEAGRREDAHQQATVGDLIINKAKWDSLSPESQKILTDVSIEYEKESFDANRAETFGYVARELGKRGIAFICAREKEADDSLSPSLKQAFGGVFIANERFTKDQANAWLAEGKADAVAFGIPFIANPDLPARLAQDAELNTPHPETFYGKGPVGYLDYPTL